MLGEGAGLGELLRGKKVMTKESIEDINCRVKEMIQGR